MLTMQAYTVPNTPIIAFAPKRRRATVIFKLVFGLISLSFFTLAACFAL